MIILLSLLSFILPAFSQSSSPVVDPNKFTICAITINSDDEKKLFSAEANKNPAKFNPVVELTDFGGSDWFNKACQSGIRCDQLVISGHFAGSFFGETGKSLPLEDIEKAGCSNKCKNILSDPYEVFLFGCNTLAGKSEDHRTPEQYLQVLLADNIPLAEASMIVEARYGAVGDSFKAGMQRAFSGEKKKLYGFDSVGPSGKNVKGFLQNYFSKTNQAAQLEKLQAKRMLDKVDESNKMLATSLKTTAFVECEAGDMNDPVMKKICSLKDENLSVDNKLALVTELMGSENYLMYLPGINKFLQENPPKSFNEAQKKEFSALTNNEVMKGQVLSLIDKTKTLGLKAEWMGFAMNLGYMDEAQMKEGLKKEVARSFTKPLTDADVDVFCSLDYSMVTKLEVKFSDIKKKNFSQNDVDALTCLNVFDDAAYTHMSQQLATSTHSETQISLMQYLMSGRQHRVDLPAATEAKVKKLLVSPVKYVRGSALFLMGQFRPQDPTYNKSLISFMNTGTSEDKRNCLYIYEFNGVYDKAAVTYLTNLAKTTTSDDLFNGTVKALMNVKTGQDMSSQLKGYLTHPKLNDEVRRELQDMVK